jgi:hypothetical protein
MAAFMKVSSRLLTVVRPAARQGDDSAIGQDMLALGGARVSRPRGCRDNPDPPIQESLLRRVHHPPEQRQPAALHIVHASYDVFVEITSPALGRALLIGFETMELAQSSQSRRLARSAL